MKKNFKKIVLLLISIVLCSALSAFNWPQNETAADSFFSYFGQLRGNTIASSLIFKDNSDVKVCDAGTVVIKIEEHDYDFGWFESTLGNAFIVAHPDNLVTVYANLDADTIPESAENLLEVQEGTFLGISGNSGWQEGQSCLEFQAIDTRNGTAINPRILMPRVGEELPLETGELTITGRDGKILSLASVKSLPSGTWSLYHTRAETAVPYKTTVSINGAAVETISYDVLKEHEGRLCVQGNSFYSLSMLYPDEKRQLLSHLRLTTGKNLITVTLSDILGTRKSVSYSIDVK